MAEFPARTLVPDDLINDQALGDKDPDQLGHAGIAAQVAALVEETKPPTNIALFGPWGAGKSSFANLLSRELGRAQTAKLVIYSAWTFAGESFQRNFISTSASALGLTPDTNPEFHTGLYEKSQGARIDLSRRQVAAFLGLSVGLAFAFLLFFSLIVYVIALIFHHPDPLASVVNALSVLLPAATLSALLGSFARELVNGARVQVDVSPPTQEQLRAKFVDLVKKGRGESSRVVFFIDELDRCRSDQVVEILAAIRHFLDQNDCVFIVAADREVLEEALKTSGSGSPVNAENPYYSSASEYIDKVFQHQLELPPLRVRRVTKFALDLVATKKRGVWAELAAVNNGKLRDDVLFVLLPSHVESPRRAKVLLNNFATTFRMAQARGLDPVENALAIAKLTALRTEFPRFAPDLILEPRLPDLLLNPPPPDEVGSDRLAELLERHALPSEEGELEPDAAPAAPAASATPTAPAAATVAVAPTPATVESTDLVVARGASAGEKRQIRLQQRRLLRRYLIRAADYQNPTRSLIYLEQAGATADLKDNAFGEMLDAESLENPAAVVTAAQKQEPDEQLKAIEILSDMASREFGQERMNVLDTMLGISKLRAYDIGKFGPTTVAALEQQRSSVQDLSKSQLAPALAIALRSGAEGLVEDLLEDERLLEDSEMVQSVATEATPWMSNKQRGPIWKAVVETYPNEPQLVSELFRDLPATVVGDLIRTLQLPTGGERLGPALVTRLNGLDAPTADAEADGLISALNGKGADGPELVATLLLRLVNDKSHGNSYGVGLRHARDLEQLSADSLVRVGTALRGIQYGRVSEWPYWIPYLTNVKNRYDDHDLRVTNAMLAVLGEWLPKDADSVTAALRGLVPLISGEFDDEFSKKVAGPIATQIGSSSWWTTAATADDQVSLFAALSTLAGVGPVTRAAVSSSIRADLERAISAGVTETALQAAVETAPLLSDADLEGVASVLAAATAPAPLDGLLLAARLRIARAAAERTPPLKSVAVDVDADALLKLRGASGWDAALGDWFALEPSFDDGEEVVVAIDSNPTDPERLTASEWAGKLTRDQRTDLLTALLDASLDISRWLDDVDGDLDEGRLAGEIDSRLAKAKLQPERLDLARSLGALKPHSPAAQKLLMTRFIWLLGKDRPKGDADAAKALVVGIRPGHGMSIAGWNAVAAAQSRGQIEITKRLAEKLLEAGIRPRKKKGLTNNIREWLKLD